MIVIHPTARISKLADIEDSTRGTRIEIGAHSMVDSFVKIKPVGGSGDLIIGEYVFINSGCVLYTGQGIRIGNSVAIAANCTFARSITPTRMPTADPRAGFLPGKGGILIEDDVWIGANCVLLDGATLRKGCVVAAGTLVKGELDAFTVYAGNPARAIGKRI